MVTSLKTHLQLKQHLAMTPQMQTALRILALPRLELKTFLENELFQNPLLEAEQDQSREISLFDEKEESDDFNWDAYHKDNLGKNFHEEREMGEDGSSLDQLILEKETLQEHLLWQVQMNEYSESQRKIAIRLVGEIRNDGYLDTPSAVLLPSLAEELKVSISQIEEVRQQMLQMDPVGCLADNLKECLLAQLEAFGVETHQAPFRLVEECLDKIRSCSHKELANQLGLNIEDIEAGIKIIERLEPDPGRAFSAAYRSENMDYVTPDVFLTLSDGHLLVRVDDEGLPKLKISSYYLNQLKKDLPPETREFIREKLRNATWVIKSFYQRQKTIHQVAEAIVHYQQDWLLDKGPLKPLSLKAIAQTVGVHESTVSRSTAGKYIQTDHGIIELKYFFGSAIHSSTGETVASEAVRSTIKKLIQGEDKKKPLSDEAITKILKKNNLDIARRTVSKYREQMRIPSSSERRAR